MRFVTADLIRAQIHYTLKGNGKHLNASYGLFKFECFSFLLVSE